VTPNLVALQIATVALAKRPAMEFMLTTSVTLREPLASGINQVRQRQLGQVHQAFAVDVDRAFPLFPAGMGRSRR
jgi:hypothetical protein